MPVATGFSGGISMLVIPEMDRFYPRVLIQKCYPYHVTVAFRHYGEVLVLKLLGAQVSPGTSQRTCAIPLKNLGVNI